MKNSYQALYDWVQSATTSVINTGTAAWAETGRFARSSTGMHVQRVLCFIVMIGALTDFVSAAKVDLNELLEKSEAIKEHLESYSGAFESFRKSASDVSFQCISMALQTVMGDPNFVGPLTEEQHNQFKAIGQQCVLDHVGGSGSGQESIKGLMQLGKILGIEGSGNCDPDTGCNYPPPAGP